MKKILALFLVAGTLAACQGNNDKKGTVAAKAAMDPGEMTTLQWTDSSQNLGKITEGQDLRISFHFTNTGDKPLVIQSVRPSCGCTVADYPKSPVAPGQAGMITASFNSHGKQGLQHKTLTVTANTRGSQQHTLDFEVEVEKPADKTAGQ